MKKKIINKKRAKETIAISQILILLIGIFAISWMIGGEFREVSAVDISSGLPICTGALGSCVASASECEKINPGARCLDTALFCCTTLKQTSTDKTSGIGDILNIGKDIGVNVGTNWLGTKLGDAAAKSTGKKVAAEGATKTGWFKNLFTEPSTKTGAATGATQATLLSNILISAAWAAVTSLIINYFAKKYASQRNAGDISTVTMVGAGVGILIGVLAAEIAGGPPGWIAAVITIAAAGIYMLVGYQIYSREIFTFRPGLWQPPEGGADCNKCNSLTIAGQNGCSEYICHSYGLACDWINDETKYETCIEINKGDAAAPIITPVKEIYGANVFPNDKYDYKTSSAGAKIIYTGESSTGGQCVPAFTSIKLAIKTNENANCKIDIEPSAGKTDSEKFSNMKDMAEGTSYTKNHTLPLPSIVTASTGALESAGYELTNGGIYKFYIRCKDVRGNINNMDYLMSFCVQSGPDTNPPEITGTNPAQNAFVAYGVDTIKDFRVYTNEPADCRWDFQPKNYDFMNYNFDKCSQNINDKLSNFDFGCQGNLTGFKKGVENKYYIACIDQPELKGTVKENKRNKGSPYELILKGTRQLLIEDIKINGKENGTIIKDSTENVKVKLEVMTFGGAEEGKARCKYSEDKTLPRTYFLFDNNNNRNYLTTNTQNLYMPKGNYKYFLQCFDIAGNIAETMVNFSVEVDNSPPIVVRVYKEEDYLKVITDEPGKCVYDTRNCLYLFDEGTRMTSLEDKEYYAEWNIKNSFYIKCEDDYGNRPDEGECSIIVRPFEIFAVQ